MRFGRLEPATVFLMAGLLALAAPARGLPRTGLPATEAEASKFLTLDNGLRVFLLEQRRVPLLSIAAAVNCGTRDETEETSGLAHLVEHSVLFRGTTTRTGAEISRDVRRHGAYFNARTGQDLIQFETCLPVSDAEFGLTNLKDILFNLRLSPEEVEVERGVILNELNLIADDPLRRATGLVFEKVFAGHPYAHPLQGRAESLARLTAGDVESFARTFFVPGNMSLALVGDMRLAEMDELVRRVFGVVPGRAFAPSPCPPAAPPRQDADITLEMDVAKAYCLIGMPGPNYNHPDQYAVDLLSQVCGRGFNPLLAAALRSGRDLVETASMSYSAMARGGLILATLTLDPKNLAAAKRKALEFMRSARKLNFGPEDIRGDEQFYAFDFIGGAKNQIRFQMYRGQERGLTVAVSLARYLILQEGTQDRNYLRSIEKVSSSDLRQAAGRYLGGGKKVIVSVVPLAKDKSR
jgi:zinc protease